MMRNETQESNDADVVNRSLYRRPWLGAVNSGAGRQILRKPGGRLRPRDARHGRVRGRRENSLRVTRQGTARRDDPRLSRLLVLVATPDECVVAELPGRGDRSTRL